MWVKDGVECPDGKLTESTALVYLKDHLGSEKAVVDAESGEVVENSDYGSYGERSLDGEALKVFSMSTISLVGFAKRV